MHTESNSFLVELSLKVLLESQGWLVGFSNHFLVGKHVHATALAGFHLKVLPAAEPLRKLGHVGFLRRINCVTAVVMDLFYQLSSSRI